MRARRRAWLFGGMAAAVCPSPAIAAVAGGTLGRVLRDGHIRIGVWLEQPPWGYRRADGTAAGTEVDVARLIARGLGVTATLVPLSLGERTAAVRERRVDLLSATMVILPERLTQLAFAQPHACFDSLLVFPASLDSLGLDDFIGRRIAVRQNTASARLLRARFGAQVALIHTDTYEESVALVRQGSADAASLPDLRHRFFSLTDANYNLTRRLPVGQLSYGLAMHHGEQDLLHTVNTLLMLARQSGELLAIGEREAVMLGGCVRAPT